MQVCVCVMPMHVCMCTSVYLCTHGYVCEASAHSSGLHRRERRYAGIPVALLGCQGGGPWEGPAGIDAVLQVCPGCVMMTVAGHSAGFRGLHLLFHNFTLLLGCPLCILRRGRVEHKYTLIETCMWLILATVHTESSRQGNCLDHCHKAHQQL